MGVVYLATDTRLDRQVAIKALPADLAADPDRLARFQRKAKVLASLNLPNVSTISRAASIRPSPNSSMMWLQKAKMYPANWLIIFRFA